MELHSNIAEGRKEMYTPRAIETVLKKAAGQTKVILLTGARQVGKTTTMNHVFPAYEYYTLDDDNELMMALNDRELFFRDKSVPMIIDEVQYAPELLRGIKKQADSRPDKGQFFLTGSQRYELMGEASESLAGRISIIEMPGLSLREMIRDDMLLPFIPDGPFLEERKRNERSVEKIWEIIHRGSMPELQDETRDREWFYRDYIRTYIERDVRKIVNIRDDQKFRSFLVSLAARSGQVLIYEDVARDVGIDIKTVQRWVSVIAASGLVKIIRPYSNNAIKRAIKAPKVFFMDTGLLCYLVGWNTVESAKNGAMSGNIFETFAVSEILKSHMNAGRSLENIYYYRDKDGKEIDLVILDGNTLYPVEIKKAATIDTKWTKKFSVLDKITDREIGCGAVICRTERIVPLDKKNNAIPVSMI